jgi:hypothetical protein
MNKKQKICLWIGTVVMDVVVGAILYDRTKRLRAWNPSDVGPDYYHKWSAIDVYLLMALIIITTTVIFYTLTTTDKKTKDE